MKTFTVIEERGYNIEYPYQENIMSEYLANKIAEEMNSRASHDEALKNGNNDPYTYRVEED